MDYKVEYRKSSMKMSAFRERYQNREKYIGFCRQCPNYATVWSCPPFDFEPNAYLAGFAWVNIVGAKINLSRELIERADTTEKVKNIGWEIVVTVKLEMEEYMRQLEKALPASLSLSSGGCNLCQNCDRRDRQPCRQPDKMRYSLDAFGFDLTAITRDMLGIEIQWCRERLPDYFTLIHGLLTQEAMAEQDWQTGKRILR